jgi:predicted MPP superfamily phosphohydrolase
MPEFLLPGSRHFIDLAVIFLVIVIQAVCLLWILRRPQLRARKGFRGLLVAVTVCTWTALGLAFILRFGRIAMVIPHPPLAMTEGAIISFGTLSLGWLVTLAISYRFFTPRPEHSESRRRFLGATRALLFAAPAAALGYGVFVQRTRLQLREQTIPITGLAPDLDGLRIAQITDIHLSAFLSVHELERAVAMANETHAHIALVTGDLISFRGDPLDACIERLAPVTAEAGVFGCLGNHEIYTDTEDYVARECGRHGIRMLRSERQTLRFGQAELNLAGVDYQQKAKPYLVGAERLVTPNALNVLLSHNPDVFPVAARKGFDLTIAGHTHGGQVRMEILRQDINIARFFTRYVDGLYQEGRSSIFVSRGIGTIGLPARLGAPPEVALLTLRRV